MKLLFLIILLSFSISTYAVTHLCDESKKLPKTINSCEGEACAFYHYDKALDDIPLFEKPSLKSKKIGLIKKCEQFNSLDVLMKMKSFGTGKVLFLNDELKKANVAVGDIVTVYQYQGEGYLALCVGNKKDIQAVVEGLRGEQNDIAVISSQKNTVNDAWVKLTTMKGVVGYSPRKYNIMWYSTIDIKKLCDPKDVKNLRHF
jgi:hypothetical protein